jgi:hypothetical protein
MLAWRLLARRDVYAGHLKRVFLLFNKVRRDLDVHHCFSVDRSRAEIDNAAFILGDE